MAPTAWKFILRYSRKEQIFLLLLTLVSFPVLYYSLDLPKTIIDEAIAADSGDFPRRLLGLDLDQIPFLMALSGIFLGLVLINGGFKFVINVYRGVVGERLLRRLRYQLFNHVLRFPLVQFRRTSPGAIVSMITAETEPLGGYFGDAVALPAFQGGTLLTILLFMFVQDPWLGLAAIALYPAQGYLIPKLQRRVNQLNKDRTLRVRKLSERITEAVGGIKEVHTHDTSQYELAEFSRGVGEIFTIRYRIYLMKFFIKFLNNFIAQITPFCFFSLGGYLVIKGQLSFGALVAVLAAYKDLSAPWKELLTFYQIKENARIKYELLYEAAEPRGLMDEQMQVSEPEETPELRGEMVVANIDLTDEDEGESTFAGTLGFRLTLPEKVAIRGGHGSGRDRVVPILATLKRPRSGSVSVSGEDLLGAPESVTGRRMALVDQDASLRAGTLRENLLYGLKHRPTRPARYDDEQARAREQDLKEARASGNCELDPDADWIDYDGAGVSDAEALTARALEVLAIADMAQDIYELGLHGSMDPQAQPAFASRILAARDELRHRLGDPNIASLVELFDRQAYNLNMTVAENLMFGAPRDPSFEADLFAENPYVRKVLHETGLMQDFLRIGREVAVLMVDLFADVEPDSELFERFSFISADDLPRFQSLLARWTTPDYDALEEEDRAMLLTLPFKLVPARHRLGLIDEGMQARLLNARRVFAEGFDLGPPPVDFFDVERYNPAVSIQDNILFGRPAYGRPRSAAEIGKLIEAVVEKLDLRRVIMETGLDYQVGIGGSRLSPTQRQKLSIARSVLKRPDILLLDEATAILDDSTESRIKSGLLEEFHGRSLIWSMQRDSLATGLGHALVLEDGRVVRQGPVAELFPDPSCC